MLWIKNEMTKAIENSILNGAKVYSHVVNREAEDFNHVLHRQNKAVQTMQQQYLTQVGAFWSFWLPQR